MTRKALLTSIFAASSAFLLTGCASGEEGPTAEPIFDLQPAECFNTDAENTAAFIVTCDEPHTYEVTHVHAIEGDDYPGDDAIQTLVDETCPDAFATYTGTAPAASTNWAAMVFAPTEPGWNEQGDRALICVVTPIDGEPVTESAKG